MIKSKKKWFLFLFRLIGSILLIYLGLKDIFAIRVGDQMIVRELLISGFIGIMGILSLILVLLSYEIEVTERELIKKFFFGFYKKKTQRERIERFAELNFEMEYLYSKSLFLLGDNINIVISSIEISNYEEVKSEVIKGLNEDKECQQSMVKYNNWIGIIILIFILIIALGCKIIGI